MNTNKETKTKTKAIYCEVPSIFTELFKKYVIENNIAEIGQTTLTCRDGEQIFPDRYFRPGCPEGDLSLEDKQFVKAFNQFGPGYAEGFHVSRYYDEPVEFQIDFSAIAPYMDINAFADYVQKCDISSEFECIGGTAVESIEIADTEGNEVLFIVNYEYECCEECGEQEDYCCC